MRYAIVSDIHANIRAWEAVLADIRTQGVDVIVCLGDVVGYGPKPAEVLEAVRSVTDHFVLGNHDAAAVGMMDYSIFNDHARQAIEWTITELSSDAKQFLSSVPLAIEAGELLFVHAEIAEPGRFDYIDSVEIAKENFAASKHFATFVGHTHLPKMFELSADGSVQELLDTTCGLDAEKRYIINVGSVGEPRNPDDLSSRYAVYDVEKREIDFRHVEFDIVAYRRDLDATNLDLHPYFLRVYEQVFEGRNAVVSSGGSLVDMQVSHDSAALVDLKQVSTIVQLSNSGTMLASAQPSRTPLYALGTAAILIIASLIFWVTKENPPSPSQNDRPVVSKKKESLSKEKPKKEPEEKERREVVDPKIAISKLPAKQAPPKAKPNPPDPEPIPTEPEKEGIQSDLEPVVEVNEKKAKSTWWRMNKEAAESSLVDNSGQIKLGLVRPGKATRAIAPDPVPLNQAANDSALILGIWQEEKADGIFSLNTESSYTFEGWFIADKLRRPIFLLGTRTGEGEDNQGWHIDLRPPARGKKEEQMAFFYDSGTQRVQALAEAVKVADKKPHHFAITWNHEFSNDEGEMALFLDGTKVAAASVAHSNIPGEQTNPLRIGSLGNKTPIALDEIRFTRKALQPHEFLLKTAIVGATMVKGNSSNRDSWSIPTNWERGQVPSPNENVIISEGLTAQVENSPPEPYSGSLILRKNSQLILWGSSNLNTLPKAPGGTIMHENSRLILSTAEEVNFGPIELIENASVYGGASTNGQGGIRKFNGAIKGGGKLILNGVNRNQFRLETANTFSGGLMAHSTQNEPFYIVAAADASFGTGDVHLKENSSLIIEANLNDTIANTAALSLEGVGSLRINGGGADPNKLYKLLLQSDETVAGFFIDGVDQGEGLFSGETHPAITGPGKLTVKRPDDN
jgi:predicted phosphodiesterase